MSSTTTYDTPPQRQIWIVSGWWDMAYIVITPLLIVPVVLALVRHRFTPEEVSLAVIAFATLGHHLPGFMRAYGDHDLFRRYRARFLLVPLMIFSMALLFSPPANIASALSLPWRHMHGLELILLCWGTWHGLMQTYGFMRIYDVRLGINDRWSAQLDYWLCLSIFVAGVVFSDARVFGITNAMWQSGLPLFGPEWLTRVRIVVGGIGLCVLAMYLVSLGRRWQRGEPVSGLKLLLAVTTGWFYWYLGRLSTNVLIGLAMFEIYHAVQYDAIVWIYNRRLFRQAGSRFGPLGFLFRDRWSMLGIYLAAIAAYSSIRYFTVDANAYVFRGGSQDAHQWLVALFVTSSFLHFYFDGFIWKVSEKKTQQTLIEGSAPTAFAGKFVPGLVHAGKLAILLIIAGGLLFSEFVYRSGHQQRTSQRLAALAALTPNLPECQSLLSRQALEQGDASKAIEYAQQALALRPRSHSAYADLGLAQMQAGQLENAKGNFETAMRIAPKLWFYHSNLGIILARLGKVEEAEHELERGIELRPEKVEPRQHLIDFYLQQNRREEATAELQEFVERFPQSYTADAYQVMTLTQEGKFVEAVRLACFLIARNPDNWRAQFVLGATLNAHGKGQLAIGALEHARRLQPRSALVRYQLGLAYQQAGQPSRAVAMLADSVRLDPQLFEAQFQLANALLVLGKTDAAIAAFQHCRKLQPRHPGLCANYGGVLAQLGKIEKAEQIYREGIEANPDSARLNFNLGVLLWQSGKQEEARQRIKRAEQLGIKIPAEVRKAMEE
ncbi:MAG: tetratricopeptide repeat protein [Planctomycetes bacterium]|nr:tetratricopeptide repeat protein [Planctomycetota bacterium]